ncbi:hypothetical protein M501DRAFT_916113, partial [Patellaria atrata CBS 101060]
NGGPLGGGIMDGSGTINPAALNSSVLSNPTSNVPPQQSPRGLKRSRSPEVQYGEYTLGDDDDTKPRKRGRPPKSKITESPNPSVQPLSQSHSTQVQTPQVKTQPLPQTSPTQISPAKSTPTKTTVIKALPTVRDHTTDQLGPEGDEYIPREFDEAGEKKVTANGQLLDGREYRCRTFFVPHRGDKLFMLATECARVLNYRDSYLLFNKNRSLYKIIATQAEKDDLIHQEILPYSYRSRQIAIVTARSMFRQFGSRVVQNGRRVRDDYWESKARKQGFTEEDAAGEKRPGAAKQREAAAAEAANAHALTALPHGEIVYSNGPGQHTIGGINPTTLAPLINTVATDDMRPRDYSNVQRPRHEMTGPPYLDRSQPSTTSEHLGQAAQTAEFNRSLAQQRMNRSKFLDDYWKRPHESPVTALQQPPAVEGENLAPATTQGLQSPQVSNTTATPIPSAPQNLSPHPPQASSQITATHAYTQQQHAQNIMAQSPVRPMHQQPIRPDQMHHRSPVLNMGTASGHGQPGSYGYPPNQMWPPQHTQPSPLSQTHNIPQYAQHPQQHSPHPQQSPLHAPPQLHHAQSSGSMHGPGMVYPSMSGMGASGYPTMNRHPYQQSPTPQQFLHQSSAAQQPGMQGWAPGPLGQGPQQNWQGY